MIRRGMVCVMLVELGGFFSVYSSFIIFNNHSYYVLCLVAPLALCFCHVGSVYSFGLNRVDYLLLQLQPSAFKSRYF